ncbi:Uncharacterised protein [Staphylococcus xylosus]|nr:hypothetical protein BTM19_08190 [Staphylococcus xylosus]PNZ14657.1 hypothetical protein CD106_08415 [Staphylococcus xylosus]GEQ11571.1 hypothetical protein SXY01_21150 [Staphylococcus xylosus]SUM98953.1 Uncharacterised protein [Staphylococcus xylosus]
MNNKWKADLLKAIFTFIFILLSYFCAINFNIMCIFPFLTHFFPQDIIFTMSVALYTSIFNFILFLFLSFRSMVDMKVIDSRDKSNTIKLDGKPRKISVKVDILGNTSNVKGHVFVYFPDWIDVTKTNDPEIKTISQYIYGYNLKNNTNSFTFNFDININALYEESVRESEIKVDFKGCKIKYGKNVTNLKIHNR